MVIYDFPLPQEYGQSIAGIQFALEVIVGGADGTPALLSSVEVSHTTGTSNVGTWAQCAYMTPDKSVVYLPGPIGSPKTIYRREVNHRSLTPTGLPTISSLDSKMGLGQGFSDTDNGPYTQEPLPSWPAVNLDDTNGRFYYKNGVWYGLTFAGAIYAGALSATPAASAWAIAVDGAGNVYVVMATGIARYDSTLTLLETKSITASESYTSRVVSAMYDDDAGILWLGFAAASNGLNHFYAVDYDGGTISSVYTLDDAPVGVEVNSKFSVSGQILTRFYYAGDPEYIATIERWRLPTPGSTGEDLAAVVRRRLERSELIQPADIDVTDLSGTVRGYKTQGAGSVRQRIEPLMLTHHFDLIMSGYQLKAVTRGNSSAMTIDPDDLDARPYGTAPGVALGQSREMDTQLPSVVVVKSLDKDRDYEINQQQSQTMAASKSVNVKEFTLTEVFTPAETASIAEVLWTRSWLERTPFKFNLPQTYRAMEATDVVTLPMTYATYELYLTSVNYTLDNRVECEAVLNDSAIYTTNAVGGTGNVSTTVIPYGGNSLFMPLNIPAPYDEYTGYGFPAAMCGYTSSWPGGVMARSIDQGQSYTPVQGFAGPVVSGEVPTPLAQDDGFVINYTDQLTVRFYSSDMSISSITEAQMKSGQNWAAYGAEGRWEILLFANATNNGDGTFTLDTILRGAKGTEWATGLHEAYDQFVFLSDADMDFIGMDVNGYNVERLYKGITTGQSLDSVTAQAFTYTGVNLKPYAPTQLDASLSGSDWVITWKRRSRYESSYFTNGVAVPLGEATEAYEIDIMNGATVVRTIEAASQTATYTAAQQTTDFGTTQSSITFRVYQISAVVGRGYVTEATV